MSTAPTPLRDRLTQGLFASRRTVIGALVLILAASLLVRLWRLGSIPTVFFHDECDNTVNAISILQGKGPGIFGLDWKPQPALGVHIIAWAIRLVGPSVAAIRLPSALLSVAALVPFFILAHRAAGPTAALLSTLLLSFNVGYLHFSRSGWENVQICLYTLLAMEAATRLKEGRGMLWWVVAGFSAALGAYIYFAGRAIIMFLLLDAGVLFLHGRVRRLRVAVGAALMLLTFIAAVAPLYPTLKANWGAFNQRSRAVLITQELPPGAGAAAIARKMLESGTRAIQAFYRGPVNNEPRYAPSGRPFLDGLSNGLLLIGMIAALVRPWAPLLWWLAFIVPFVLTQMLTTGAPNLARGIGLIPIAYLFVAFGMGTIERLLGRWRLVAQVPLVVLVLLSAFSNLTSYFKWAGGPELAVPLQPAVQLADFEAWWDLQNQWIRENRGFLNVNEWLARHAPRIVPAGPPPVGTSPAPLDEAAVTTPRPPTGTVYRGSTTAQPYEIDLGKIALTGGVLEVEVFAVPGADCVYDYLDVVGYDGRRARLEAEDSRFTFGDQPVPDHLPDNHWWLQNYDPFSAGQGLVALKSEVPPPLVTRVRLAPGTYQVHLGSFTGDAVNGVFAVQVNMHEASAPAKSAR